MIFGGIFLAIILAYIAAHTVVYVSIVRFFSVHDRLHKKLLLGALVIFGLSFVILELVAHKYDNALVRSYYFISGVWVGLLINLLLFFVAVWVVRGIAGYFHVGINLKIAGITAVLLAVGFVAYGIWNAFTPTVKQIDVSIKNLPKQWDGKKVVQISDVHLGEIYRPQYFARVAQKINALDPDLILITGDLFDGSDGNLADFASALNSLHAKNGIYFSTGNHETYIGVDKSLNVMRQTDITVLQDEMRAIDGLQIIGIDYPQRTQQKDIARVIKNIPDFNNQEPSILMWHIPTQIQEAQQAGISLMLSGHTHKGQLFPFGIISHLVFAGRDYGLKQDGAFVQYTSCGLGGWGPPMRTEARSEIVEFVLHK